MAESVEPVKMRQERRVVMAATPAAHEGVGRALRAAFRGKIDRLPLELEDCIARLG